MFFGLGFAREAIEPVAAFFLVAFVKADFVTAEPLAEAVLGARFVEAFDTEAFTGVFFATLFPAVDWDRELEAEVFFVFTVDRVAGACSHCL